MNKIEILAPMRIMKEHNTCFSNELIGNKMQQVIFRKNPKMVLKSGGFLVLDYGKEMQGGIKVLIGEIMDKNGDFQEADLRFRFGESLMECCAELGEKDAGNYHSMRDFTARVTTHGCALHGDTGFRFVRIDNISEYDVPFYSVIAVNSYFGGEQLGTFKCSDPLINQIFDTAVYTLALCIQNGYIWDGIKRDRAVWIGDMHPEVMSTFLVYGNIEEVRASLDFCKEATPDNEWINAIPTYSFWWMWVMAEYVKYSGDLTYVDENRAFILHIFNQIEECLEEDGTWDPRKGKSVYFGDNEYFFDWPTNFTADSEYGVRALMLIALQKIKEIYTQDEKISKTCDRFISRIEKKNQCTSNYKQVTAMRVLAEKQAGQETLDTLTLNNAAGMGCFMANYILSAVAKLGATEKAVEMLKEYYGGMLSMGATTFWEDFDIEWMNGSSKVDEFSKEGQKNIHADFGKFCYKHLRHSLCHGWSVGVIPFVYQWLLGVSFEGIGCKKMYIQPRLCGLSYIEASLPTPYGVVRIEHTAGTDGKVITKYTAPEEIEVVIKEA